MQALSAAAHEKNIPLVADTTAIPFTQFSAKDLGVDIEVVSSSKYVSGGATSLGGVVIDYATEYCGDFGKKLYGEMLFNFGAYMTPQVAYMQTIGLETLDARYRVQSSNALSWRRSCRSFHKSSVSTMLVWRAILSMPWLRSSLARRQVPWFASTWRARRLALSFEQFEVDSSCYEPL